MLSIILAFLLTNPQIYCYEKKGSNMIIKLPPFSTKGNISLEEAILKRRSIRSFKEDELSLNEISQILWSAQGITKKTDYINLRSAPSAGAIYPITVFVVKKDGVFEYLPEEHSLKPITQKDIRTELSKASLNQRFIEKAPLSLILCADYSKITKKYANRGIQYAHIEVGHIAQNINLQAVALGLGSVCVGAFEDEKVSKVAFLPSSCRPIYIIPIGKPKQ